MYTTLISAAELDQIKANKNVRIFDCRFQLADTEAGRKIYQLAHIPGASYVHLDDDLSGAIIPGQTGRHPLPTAAEAARRFGAWGIANADQVVVYDDKKGAIAARLWWMLRWLGHDAVAVLEGGWQAWEGAGLAATNEVTLRTPTTFEAKVRENLVATVEEVVRERQNADFAIVDSRAAVRYRGEQEPIDPVAGHIPGAINLPFPENWQADGRMKSVAELAARFADLPAPEKTIFYCGSGVTACHNLLAYQHADLGEARLYPGSWSEWIVDESRPIATGKE